MLVRLRVSGSRVQDFRFGTPCSVTVKASVMVVYVQIGFRV